MRNWAGNYEYRARRVVRPGSMEELQETVRSARTIRALGSRHSFNDIADSEDELLTLDMLPKVVDVDAASSTVRVEGAVRYGELCQQLEAEGFALHNLASLPHISVAGGCATATHGSGDRNGCLSTAVTAMSIVRADGELVRLRRGDADFAAAAVSLGALGIVVDLTLQIEPSYRVRQNVFTDLPLADFEDRFDEIASSAYSVSFFTQWRGPVIDQVWLKQRVDADDEPLTNLFGARPAQREVHPIRGLPPDACTPQRGVTGPWHERLPHFRIDHTPSSGDELQSEYIVPRENAMGAFAAIDALRDRIAPLTQVSEVRTIARDDLWLSPAFDRPSVGFHFTWQPDWPSVRDLLPDVEAALAPFEPRPHWAKLFSVGRDSVRARYERSSDFVSTASRFDPEGKFRNEFLQAHLFA